MLSGMNNSLKQFFVIIISILATVVERIRVYVNMFTLTLTPAHAVQGVPGVLYSISDDDDEDSMDDDEDDADAKDDDDDDDDFSEDL